MTLEKKHFESIVGKEENAGNQHFLFLPQCFLPIPIRIFFVFKLHLFCCLQMLSIWTNLKNKEVVESKQAFAGGIEQDQTAQNVKYDSMIL